MSKTMEVRKIKKEESKSRKAVIKGKLLEKQINQIDNDYHDLIDDVMKSAIEGNVSFEDVKNLIEKKKTVTDLKKSAIDYNESLKFAKKREVKLTSKEKKKIQAYYDTEDFSQEELGDSFGVSQATISRIVKG